MLQRKGIMKVQTSVLLFTIGMLLTKLSSFLVNVALTYKYGAGYISDAIIISMNIPTILFAGLIAAISLCYVPLYKELETFEKEKINFVTSNLINFIAVLFLILCIFLFSVPELFIRILANGMHTEGILLASKLTRWVAVASLLTSSTGLLQGYLQANNKFYLISISVLPVNIILACSIGLSNCANVEYILGLGFIIAFYGQFGLFLFETKKIGFVWKPILKYNDLYIKKLFLLVVPILTGTLLYDINSIVDKSFASLLEPGSISILDYSYKVAGAAQGILAYPLTTILYTKLAEESSRSDFKSINVTVNRGIVSLSLFMLPVITTLIVTSDFIIRVLFFRGNFSEQSVLKTSVCLIIYLIGMYAVSYRALFEKAFYSLQLTRLTLRNTVVTVVVHVIMDFLLYNSFDCYGLAAATSFSLIVSTYYLYILLKNNLGFKLLNETLNSMKKIIFAVIVMFSVILITKVQLEHLFFASLIHNMLFLFLVILEGSAFYLILLYLLKETVFLNALRNEFKWLKNK